MNGKRRMGRVRRSMWLALHRLGHGACVIHDRAIVNSMPPSRLFKTYCRKQDGAASCPEDLTICLVHNYPTKPIMERSLAYFGIDDYYVLQPDCKPWRHTAKLKTIYEALQSGTIPRRKYLLFVDSDDAILVRDPKKVISLLQKAECELLFSATGWAGGLVFVPDTMDSYRRQLARGIYRFRRNPFPNTGCYIGTMRFLETVLSEAMPFITENDLTPAKYNEAITCGTLPAGLDALDFRRGFGCDQLLMSYLTPKYGPRVKIDYGYRLAFRFPL